MKDLENWLTMKEACAYLKVSHMTIRRWMKANRLNCFRFGNGLRFRKDDLDQIAKKSSSHTAEAEPATENPSCPLCGQTELIEGRLQSTGKLYFKPNKTKFFTFQESLIPTESLMCSACGYIMLSADTDKLEKLK